MSATFDRNPWRRRRRILSWVPFLAAGLVVGTLAIAWNWIIGEHGHE